MKNLNDIKEKRPEDVNRAFLKHYIEETITELEYIKRKIDVGLASTCYLTGNLGRNIELDMEKFGRKIQRENK